MKRRPRRVAPRPLLAGFLALAVAARATAAPPSDRGAWLRSRLAEVPEGAVLTAPAGIYQGPFVLERPVRLRGDPGAILQGNRQNHVVAVRADDVEVSGFLIRGSGRDLSADHAGLHLTGARALIRDNRIVDCLHGIYVRQADQGRFLHNTILGEGAPDPSSLGDFPTLRPRDADSCATESPRDRRGNGIHLWNSRGHLLADNTIRGTRDGIYFSFTDATTVSGNDIRQVRYGLHYMYSDDNVFADNHFQDNAAGAALMYSHGLLLRGNRFLANRSHRAYGLLLQSVDDSRIEANRFQGNTLGLYVENGNRLTVRDNQVIGNHLGLRLSDSSTDCLFLGNTFRGNLHPVETSGVNLANRWSGPDHGNRWDHSLQLDLDANGLGDLPHREPDLFGPWRRVFPAIGLLSASPAERLLRLIHGRLAIAGVPAIIDPLPLLGHLPPP